jgi:hypothetical protein
MWARDPVVSPLPVGAVKVTKRCGTARRLASAKHTTVNIKSEETGMRIRGEAFPVPTICPRLDPESRTKVLSRSL